MVEKINAKIIYKLDGALHTPYSVTKLPDESSTMYNLLSEEFLNSHTALDLPNRALKLMENCLCVFMQNK